MKKTLLIILSLWGYANAAEVDNFTGRNLPLNDATLVLNHAANLYLDQAIDAANKRGHCDKKRLYRKISTRFRDNYNDKFSHFAYKAPEVPKRRVKIKDSIYADFTSIESFIMGGLGLIFDSNAPVVNIQGHQIGSDKFEHFFGMGYFYFKRFYLRSRSVQQVLDFGRKTETGILGANMTGVISYADLAANFKGMHFWNHLLNQGQDVLDLGSTPGPYIACKNEKWQRVKDVDLAFYVDDAWDEAINCSLFRTEQMLEKIKLRMDLLSQTDGTAITCPVQRQGLQQIEKIYAPYAKQLLNFKGHGILVRK